jgi:hypothetical protein
VHGSKPIVVEVDGTRFKEYPSALEDLLDEPDAGP